MGWRSAVTLCTPHPCRSLPKLPPSPSPRKKCLRSSTCEVLIKELDDMGFPLARATEVALKPRNTLPLPLPHSKVPAVVDETLLKELEDMGFPLARATRALHFSGNSTVEGAVNWLEGHGDDADLDDPLLVKKV